MATTCAVLFDFGGTLCTAQGFAATARQNAREIAGWFGLDGDLDRVIRAIGTGVGQAFREHASRPFYLHRDVFHAGYRYGLAELGVEFTDDHIQRARVNFTRLQALDFALQEGVVETLTVLRNRGLHLGIVSNADEDQLAELVALAGLAPYFDSILSSEAAGSCKPDPGIFREALRRAGCAPGEALFVGDTPDHDIVGAKRAGLRTVLLATGEERPAAWPGGDEQPDHVIRSIRQVVELLG